MCIGARNLSTLCFSVRPQYIPYALVIYRKQKITWGGAVTDSFRLPYPVKNPDSLPHPFRKGYPRAASEYGFTDE